MGSHHRNLHCRLTCLARGMWFAPVTKGCGAKAWVPNVWAPWRPGWAASFQFPLNLHLHHTDSTSVGDGDYAGGAWLGYKTKVRECHYKVLRSSPDLWWDWGTTGWIDLEFCSDIHAPQRMNPTGCFLLWNISTIIWWIAFTFGAGVHGAQRLNCKEKGIPWLFSVAPPSG